MFEKDGSLLGLPTFKKKLKENGMLCHSLGGAVIIIPLQHFIAPAFYLLPCCKPEVWGIAIRAARGSVTNNLDKNDDLMMALVFIVP